jgi:HPt (histidine-containing phosphotransfer) domain-containing protein
MGPIPPIQWNEVLAAVGDDRGLLEELIQAFLQESPQLLAGIERSLGEPNAAEVQRQAHSLKSSLRFFGVASAADLAWRVEEAAQDAKLDAVPAILSKLKDELAAVQAALSAGPPP